MIDKGLRVDVHIHSLRIVHSDLLKAGRASYQVTVTTQVEQSSTRGELL